jgi:peroxiredoxin
MRKIVLSALFLMASVGSTFSQSTVEVKGKVKFINDNFKVTAFQREGTEKKILSETTVNPDHTYQFTVTTAKPGVVTIDCGQWQSVNTWVEDENMEIDFRGMDTARIKIKNPPYVYIKAGKKNEVMNLINFESYRNYQSMIAISQAVYRSPITDEKDKQKLSFKLYDDNSANYDAHMRYIAEHYADRTSVIAVLQRLNQEKDGALIEQALKEVEANNPGTTLVSDYRAKVKSDKENQERMKDGKPLPDFSLPDANGKLYSLKNFKGKVIVIDFWASWCGPCRQEIPNVKKYYEEFKSTKKVAFVSVSIDAKRPDWEKAVKEENMPWLQLLAPKGGKDVMDTYQFGGIPYILVIDKEGNIYKKNLRGEEIENAIKDVLAGKKAQAPKVISMGSMGMM